MNNEGEIQVTFADTTGKKNSVNCPYGVMADTLLPGFGVN